MGLERWTEDRAWAAVGEGEPLVLLAHSASCPHCVAFEPVFEGAARALGPGHRQFAAVEVGTDGTGALVRNTDITLLPTVLRSGGALAAGHFEKLADPAASTHDALLDFASLAPYAVARADSPGAAPTDLDVVLFAVPFCPACVAATKLVGPGVRVVNPVHHAALARAAGVEEVPQLAEVASGRRLDGRHTEEAMAAFVGSLGKVSK